MEPTNGFEPLTPTLPWLGADFSDSQQKQGVSLVKVADGNTWLQLISSVCCRRFQGVSLVLWGGIHHGGTEGATTDWRAVVRRHLARPQRRKGGLELIRILCKGRGRG